jgi:hypothetical protein
MAVPTPFSKCLSSAVDPLICRRNPRRKPKRCLPGLNRRASPSPSLPRRLSLSRLRCLSKKSGSPTAAKSLDFSGQPVVPLLVFLVIEAISKSDQVVVGIHGEQGVKCPVLEVVLFVLDKTGVQSEYTNIRTNDTGDLWLKTFLCLKTCFHCIISGALTFLQKVSMLFTTRELYTIDLVSCFDGAPRALHVSEWSKRLSSPWQLRTGSPPDCLP